MNARKQTIPAQKTVTAAAAQQVVQPNGADNVPVTESNTLESILERFGFKKRTTFHNIALLVARVSMYAVGVVCTLYITSVLSTAMMMGGWPMFLIMVIELIAMILGCIASWHLSDRLIDFIADGGVTKTTAKVGGWFSNLFSSEPKAA